MSQAKGIKSVLVVHRESFSFTTTGTNFLMKETPFLSFKKQNWIYKKWKIFQSSSLRFVDIYLGPFANPNNSIEIYIKLAKLANTNNHHLIYPLTVYDNLPKSHFKFCLILTNCIFLDFVTFLQMWFLLFYYLNCMSTDVEPYGKSNGRWPLEIKN